MGAQTHKYVGGDYGLLGSFGASSSILEYYLDQGTREAIYYHRYSKANITHLSQLFPVPCFKPSRVSTLRIQAHTVQLRLKPTVVEMPVEHSGLTLKKNKPCSLD